MSLFHHGGMNPAACWSAADRVNFSMIRTQQKKNGERKMYNKKKDSDEEGGYS